jgi:lipopolysaccharide/colanic/teichoic acid biosynthesis glycosyltransferase
MLAEINDPQATKTSQSRSAGAQSLAGPVFRWNYQGSLKRWTDVALTVFFLPVIVPFSLFVALLIKLDSRGPVLVKLRRLGEAHSSFYKYKFRTMVPEAEKVLLELLRSNEQLRAEYLRTYKIRNDPRITRFGHLLRRTSLDELPQVFNVLKGEMSWVGPRDILDSELVMYGEFGNKFVTVKPGITGLWQVSGRSRLTYAERVRLDILYIDNVSFWLDMKILLRTIPVVLFGDGAI